MARDDRGGGRVRVRGTRARWFVISAVALAMGCAEARVLVLDRPFACRQSASPSGVAARPSDELVNSIGVDAFLHFTNTPYDAPFAEELVGILGVRHLRMPVPNMDVIDRVAALRRDGVTTM